METLHFPGRDVSPWAEHASADSLVEGRVYYRLGYLDEELTIPSLHPFVFIGRNLDLGRNPDADDGHLYFQDAESYLAGIRHDDKSRTRHDVDVEVHRVLSGTPFVYEFDKALDRLLYLSLERTGR